MLVKQKDKIFIYIVILGGKCGNSHIGWLSGLAIYPILLSKQNNFVGANYIK